MTGTEFLQQLKQAGCKGDKYSDNLAKWLKKRKDWPVEAAFLHWSNIDGSHVEIVPGATQPNQILLGHGKDGDGWFYGTKLNNILSDGTRAEQYAYPPKFQTTPLPDWHSGYVTGGKCFIDPEHRWYSDRDRWLVSEDGNARICRWCGDFEQVKHETNRVIIDTHWRAK